MLVFSHDKILCFCYCSCLHVYPHAIAAHPLKPTQFAVGLTNGEVYIIEPNELGDTWAVLPPDEIVGDQPTSTSEGDRAMDGWIPKQ